MQSLVVLAHRSAQSCGLCPSVCGTAFTTQAVGRLQAKGWDSVNIDRTLHRSNNMFLLSTQCYVGMNCKKNIIFNVTLIVPADRAEFENGANVKKSNARTLNIRYSTTETQWGGNQQQHWFGENSDWMQPTVRLSWYESLQTAGTDSSRDSPTRQTWGSSGTSYFHPLFS